MQRALGFRKPMYAHLPLILNPDRSKMSKRFADTALSDYRDEGISAGGIMNFLAFPRLASEGRPGSPVTRRTGRAFSISTAFRKRAQFSTRKNWIG